MQDSFIDDSRQVFGKLLVLTRRNNHQLLYTMLGDVKKIEIKNNTLILTILSTSFDMVNKNSKILQNLLKEINSNYDIKIEKYGETKEEDIQEFLIKKFGKALKII